jgi:hypothetical protein
MPTVLCATSLHYGVLFSKAENTHTHTKFNESISYLLSHNRSEFSDQHCTPVCNVYLMYVWESIKYI